MTAQAAVLLADRHGASVDRDDGIAAAVLFGWDAGTQVALGFFADYSAAVAAIKTITIKKSAGRTSTGPYDVVTLAIGSTPTAVSSTAFQYAIATAMAFKAAVAAGTALAAGTIPTNTWGVYLFSINAAGTIACTAGAANFTTGYASEALALAALPATPADQASMGHVTVLTAVGSPFVGGTDALEGGAGGNPSSDTNYYSTASVVPSMTNVIPPLRWDFAKGPAYLALPGVLSGDRGGSLIAELQASGAGGVTGRITLMGFAR